MSTNELLEAITGANTDRVVELLAADPSLAAARNENGTSAVLLALYYRQSEALEALLATGVALDVFDASAVGRAGRVAELIAADPGLVGAYAGDGFYPLGLACFFGHKDVAEVLLGAGADPNQAASNAMKVAPLHAAAAAGRADIVALLLEKGANPNARQQMGFVPLHEAARAGNLDLAHLLVDHGADVNAATDDGKRPLAIAVEAGKTEMAAYLESKGAAD